MGVVDIPPNPVGPGHLSCTLTLDKEELQITITKLKQAIQQLGTFTHRAPNNNNNNSSSSNNNRPAPVQGTDPPASAFTALLSRKSHLTVAPPLTPLHQPANHWWSLAPDLPYTLLHRPCSGQQPGQAPPKWPPGGEAAGARAPAPAGASPQPGSCAAGLRTRPGTATTGRVRPPAHARVTQDGRPGAGASAGGRHAAAAAATRLPCAGTDGQLLTALR